MLQKAVLRNFTNVLEKDLSYNPFLSAEALRLTEIAYVFGDIFKATVLQNWHKLLEVKLTQNSLPLFLIYQGELYDLF